MWSQHSNNITTFESNFLNSKLSLKKGFILVLTLSYFVISSDNWSDAWLFFMQTNKAQDAHTPSKRKGIYSSLLQNELLDFNDENDGSNANKTNSESVFQVGCSDPSPWWLRIHNFWMLIFIL